jgi:hypothetical protein
VCNDLGGPVDSAQGEHHAASAALPMFGEVAAAGVAGWLLDAREAPMQLRELMYAARELPAAQRFRLQAAVQLPWPTVPVPVQEGRILAARRAALAAEAWDALRAEGQLPR